MRNPAASSSLSRLLLLTAALLLASCDGAWTAAEPVFYERENPRRLSEWGLFDLRGAELVPAAATEVFVPANQLFSDYALKLRTMWLPDGGRMELRDGEYRFPLGAVLSKTFYYPVAAAAEPEHSPPTHSTAGEALVSWAPPQGGSDSHERIDLEDYRLLETRLLVKRDAGWEALAYVWDDEEREAFLHLAGADIPLSLHGTAFTYFVPDRNQCAACHVTEHPDGAIRPLAATVRQLQHRRARASGDSGVAILEAERLVARGWLDAAPSGPVTVDYRDPTVPLAARAAEYLNINCGHCHNAQGAADTSALILDDYTSPDAMGVCKPPVAAGGGSGGRQYNIVPGEPDRSILIYRMESSRLDEMMPELGRSLPHREGIRLIRDWIAAMPGSCSGL